MKKVNLLITWIISSIPLLLAAQDTLVQQSFEGAATAWSYFADPPPYNITEDIWDTVAEIEDLAPYQGSLFWGIRDLDNNNGGGNFFHKLLFDSVNLAGFTNCSLSLRYNAVAFDAGDKLHLDLFLDGAEEHIVLLNGASGGVSTDGWQEFLYAIPDSIAICAVHLKAKQNGGTDRAGWDQLMITGFPEGAVPLTASFSADKTFTFCHELVTFENLTWGGTPPYTLSWDFDHNGTIDDTVPHPQYGYATPGRYYPKLFVEDQEGDTASFILPTPIEIIPQPRAWINEIHYDDMSKKDPSKDTNEGVEVVIGDTTFLHLPNYTLSLYNGHNGKVYQSETLDHFTVGDTLEAFHFFHHFFGSLQNGAPDGVALDYLGKPLTFLSYEGTFEATNGPAEGLWSTDIGATEDASTPVGRSIQCQGVGEEGHHFYWTSLVEETFGHPNIGQFLAWPAQTTWIGTTPHWLSEANWDNGIPGPGTEVLLDAGEAVYPTLSQQQWCKTLTLNEGAYLLDSTSCLHPSQQITVNRWLAGGTSATSDPDHAIYHFIGSPLPHCKAIDVLPPNAYVRAYHEPSQSWVNLTGSDFLLPGKGYSVYLPSANNQLTFSDSLPNTDLSFHNLSLSGSNLDYSGFHLLSNPFLSPIDWDLLPKEQVAQTVYLWHNGDYLEWNGLVGSLPGGIIPVGQGFFVQVTDAQNHIAIPPTAMVPDTAPIYKSEELPVLTIALLWEELEDNAFLAFKEDATSAFDPPYDALKLSGQAHHPEVYLIQNDLRYAICFTHTDSVAEFYLGIKAPQEGDYTLQFGGPILSMEYPLFLKDLYTNNLYDIRKTPVHEFFSFEGTFEDRFVITQQPVGIQEAEKEPIRITQHEGLLTLHTSQCMEITILSITGQVVEHRQRHCGTYKIPLPPGIYLLKTERFIRKLIIL
ncbi:MAG: hypothetical protein CSA95_03895 [Bacteroidetes bacterium]|nr:MAG: hypothetical protein CSA95_03895 [Bacteroidota bacterium]